MLAAYIGTVIQIQTDRSRQGEASIAHDKQENPPQPHFLSQPPNRFSSRLIAKTRQSCQPSNWQRRNVDNYPRPLTNLIIVSPLYLGSCLFRGASQREYLFPSSAYFSDVSLKALLLTIAIGTSEHLKEAASPNRAYLNSLIRNRSCCCYGPLNRLGERKMCFVAHFVLTS